MASAAVLGFVARPSAPPTGAPSVILEHVVPRQFGGWAEVLQSTVQIIDPQQKELLDKLYSQVLTRTYVNREGYRIMLSLAYGGDQRGGLQAHMPEVCYPAQGFKLDGQVQNDVSTPYGAIPAQRLQTSLGARHEPVTYWLNLGGQGVNSGSRLEKRLIEFRLGVTGRVPDGLLFRVSSIDGNAVRAYEMHDQFIKDLLTSLAASDRERLSGLTS
jgi:EpsI family protein